MKYIKILFIFLLFLISPAISACTDEASCAAECPSWWACGWHHLAEIGTTSGCDPPVIIFQRTSGAYPDSGNANVITLGNVNDANQDWSDVKFTDDSLNPIGYCFLERTSTYAKIKLQTINWYCWGDSHIRVWWGNPSIAATSDMCQGEPGEDPIEPIIIFSKFFDHFEGDTLNTTLWEPNDDVIINNSCIYVKKATTLISKDSILNWSIPDGANPYGSWKNNASVVIYGKLNGINTIGLRNKNNSCGYTETSYRIVDDVITAALKCAANLRKYSFNNNYYNTPYAYSFVSTIYNNGDAGKQYIVSFNMPGQTIDNDYFQQKATSCGTSPCYLEYDEEWNPVGEDFCSLYLTLELSPNTNKSFIDYVGVGSNPESPIPDISITYPYAYNASNVSVYDPNVTIYIAEPNFELNYLTEVNRNTYGVYYLPNTMETQFVDQYYKPLANLPVSMIALNTTYKDSNFTILEKTYGINRSQYDVRAEINGTTGEDGVIIFPAMKEILYLMTVNDPVRNVTYSSTTQQNEDRNIIIIPIGYQSTQARDAVIHYTIGGNYTENLTHFVYTLDYEDTTNETINVTTYLHYKNGTVINDHTYLDDSSISHVYEFEPESGETYVYGFVANHPNYQEFNITRSFDGRSLLAIGGLSSTYLQWIAIGLIILVGALFSATSMRFGVIVIPCMAFFFWMAGWLQLNIAGGTIVVALLILGALSYIRWKDR